MESDCTLGSECGQTDLVNAVKQGLDLAAHWEVQCNNGSETRECRVQIWLCTGKCNASMESDYRGQKDLANIIKQSLVAYEVCEVHEVYAEGGKPENAWERDPRTQAAVHPSAISNAGHVSECFFVWQMSIKILAVACATWSIEILVVVMRS